MGPCTLRNTCRTRSYETSKLILLACNTEDDSRILTHREDMTPHHRLQSYYGYSFEAWSTSSRLGTPEHLDGHPQGWGGDVDTNVQWCCVAKTKLGDTRLVIGGEVDCARSTSRAQLLSVKAP